MALAFSGVGAEYITRSTGLPADTEPYTFLCCVKLDAIQAFDQFVLDLRKYVAPNTGHSAGFNSTGKGRFYLNYGAAGANNIGDAVSTGTWYWVALRCGGPGDAAVRWSIIEHGTSTIVTGTANQTAFVPSNIFVGAPDDAGDKGIDGTIAFVREFTSNLSDAALLAEIAQDRAFDTASLLLENTLRGSDLATALTSEVGANFTAPNGGVTYSADEPSFEVVPDITLGGTVGLDELLPTVTLSAPTEPSTGQINASGTFVSYAASPSVTFRLSQAGSETNVQIAALSSPNWTATVTGLSAGTYSALARIVDSRGTVQTASQTVTVSGGAATAPTITTTSLADGTAGTAYSATIVATGSSPIAWSVSSGALPTGLSLTTATGAVTGTPTVAALFGFVATATNSAGAANSALSIRVVEPAPPPGPPPAPSGRWTMIPRDSQVWVLTPDEES
jgi:hypothetical protein